MSTVRSNMEPMLDVDWCLVKNMTSVINGLYRNDSHCSDSLLDT